jgi:hypothetical protein
MSMLSFISRLFQARGEKPRGVLLYASVQEVIQAHKLLEKEGFSVRLVAPPPEIRVGCDLAIEFDIIEQEAVENTVAKAGKKPHRIVSTKEMLPDVLKRAQVIEIDGFLMCKAGNMKITVDKKERRIVNVSGGGCPDIPYVAQELYGKRIDESADPITLGNSLCSYMLQLAYDALKGKAAKK